MAIRNLRAAAQIQRGIPNREAGLYLAGNLAAQFFGINGLPPTSPLLTPAASR